MVVKIKLSEIGQKYMHTKLVIEFRDILFLYIYQFDFIRCK